VTVIPGSGAMGEKHKEVLTDFWGNVTAINAYDRNQKGKFRRLVKQMMTAVSFRYAAHHIVWEVKGGKLRATFEFVPLWLFENRTGTLRYLRDPWAQDGEILTDGEWMVTSGDGLMIACAIGWSAKRNAFNDWLIFSAKFSVPGTLGRTSAKKDSPEGRAMHEAVRTFGHDWAGVIYGDDGTHDKPIEIIQASGNPSGMPMPAVVERVDRKFAALYRGADLSTMSAGSGEGSGASLQEKEGDILLSDDAETISETLEEISKKVIEWHFGYGVEPLAKLELIVPKREDTSSLVTDATSLADRGARVSVASLMDRLSLQTAKDDADVLGRATSSKDTGGTPVPPSEEVANSALETDQEDLMADLQAALRADLQPLGEALSGALQAGDFPAMQAALKKISAGMPELAGEAENLAEVLAGQFTDAFLGDEAEDVANAFNRMQSRDLMGRWNGDANGGGGSGGDWKSYGLLPAAKITPESSSVPIPSYAAAARLAKGETVMDDLGANVIFNDELFDHWTGKDRQEIKRRLGELDDAQNAVRQPHEVWEKARQTIYLRKYKDNGPVRWMAVFVPKGTGRTYYSSEKINQADDSFRQGRLLRNR
jgi:phage gp29-like protein